MKYLIFLSSERLHNDEHNNWPSILPSHQKNVLYCPYSIKHVKKNERSAMLNNHVVIIYLSTNTIFTKKCNIFDMV